MKNSKIDFMADFPLPEDTPIVIELPPSGNTPKKHENDRFLQYLQSLKKVIILSSHLDDAVLSMGSLIFYLSQKNIQIDIFTIFTEGSPVETPAVHRLLTRAHFNNSHDYFKKRQEEDMKALSQVNIHATKHLGLVDCAWRMNKKNEPLYANFQLGDILKEDFELQKNLTTQLKQLISIENNTALFAPLAVGNHIDHQIVRNAGADAFPNAIFYQDFPYVSIHANNEDFMKQKKLYEVEWTGSYEEKKKAILEYKTQLYSFTLFFKGPIKVPFEKYFIPESLI